MIAIRLAVKDDNAALIELTCACPMMGSIPLLVDRYPDFFALTEMRGKSITLVAEDESCGIIAGVFTTAFYEGYVYGTQQEIAYMADLKVHPEYRQQKIAFRLLLAMREETASLNPRIVLCVLARGNADIFRFLEHDLGYPKFMEAGKFKVLELLPHGFGKAIKCRISNGDDTWRAQLLRAYNTCHRRRQFAKVVTRQDIKQCRHVIIEDNGSIKAALGLVDLNSVKTNIVLGIPGTYRLLMAIERVLARLLPISRAPHVGQPLRILYIRFIACREGEFMALRKAIRAVVKLAYDAGYHFITVGLHEQDPNAEAFHGLPKLNFNSEMYVTDLSEYNLSFQSEDVTAMDFSLI